MQLLETSKRANTLRLQKLMSNFLSLPTSGALSIDWVCSCRPHGFRILWNVNMFCVYHTKLLGGRHDAIPSENAEAKHEARLLLHFTGKTKGFLNPITDDSETNLGESETNHRNQTTNQYYFILHSVTDATSLVMQKWWSGRVLS